MKVNPRTGRVTATAEDYALERNLMHVHTVGNFKVYRVVNEHGQLFAACCPRNEDTAVHATVQAVLIDRARSATPPERERSTVRSILKGVFVRDAVPA